MVSALDFALGLRELDIGLADAELQKFFDLRGIGEQSQVDYTAFLTEMQERPRLMVGTPVVESRALREKDFERDFNTLDRNGDGVIDRDEWGKSQKSRGHRSDPGDTLKSGLARFGDTLANMGLDAAEVSVSLAPEASRGRSRVGMDSENQVLSQNIA